MTAQGIDAGMSKARLVRSYSTDFEGDEEPISEGGIWLNGRTDGVDWADVVTGGGVAHGGATRMAVAERRLEQGNMEPGAADAAEPEGDYDDPTAVLSGSWGRNQHARADGPQPKSDREVLPGGRASPSQLDDGSPVHRIRGLLEVPED